MALTILHDREKGRAVYYCTTSDTAIGTIRAFMGSDALEQAEDFIGYLDALYGDGDVRKYETAFLQGYLEEWRWVAFDDEDNFSPTQVAPYDHAADSPPVFAALSEDARAFVGSLSIVESVAPCGCIAYRDGTGDPCTVHHPDNHSDRV